MPIRILHTADNHIGLPFKQYPSDVAAKLIEERFESLERLVTMANQRQADFFVVAGDLFDSTRVKVEDIKRTAGIVRGFAGAAVIVVPGNHDYCVGPHSEFWKRFRHEVEGTTVELLTEAGVKTFEVGGQTVHFFACPCPSKTGHEPMIGWVATAAKDYADGLRIGIAHGNVTGLGLDAEGRYFTMDPTDLESAGVATWLLGHIHVPFPVVAAGMQSPYFMAGTPTPDSIRCRHAGSAWWLECDEDRVSRYELLTPGRIRFVRIGRELNSADDIAAVLAECRTCDAGRTVLDIQLSGRLSANERKILDEGIAALRSVFLHIRDESTIHDRIDVTQIAARYRSDGLAARLLTALIADHEFPDAATLAHELVEEASQP